MKKISELNIRIILLIQIATATVISLLFQFVFPLTWQPLDFTMYDPNIKHGGGNKIDEDVIKPMIQNVMNDEFEKNSEEKLKNGVRIY